MQKNRDNSIDLLRGIAILFMVASHVVWIFDPEITGIWDLLRDIADNISFIIFLFAFGFGIYFSLFKKKRQKDIHKKHLRRVLSIIYVYITLNLLSLILDAIKNGFDINNLIDFFLFRNIAGFTEFLIPFILLGLFSFVLTWPRTDDTTMGFLITISLFAFYYGYEAHIYSGDWFLPNTYLDGIWSIFFGHKNYYLRFPVFQYLIVFLIGIYYAYVCDRDRENRLRFSIKITVISGLVALLQFLNISIFDTQRFPVHIGFIAQNLFIAMVILLAIQGLLKLLPNFKASLLLIIGQSSLGIMFTHIFLLKLLKYFNYPTEPGNLFLLIPLYIIALCGFFVYKYIISLILNGRNNSVPQVT